MALLIRLSAVLPMNRHWLDRQLDHVAPLAYSLDIPLLEAVE